MARPVQRRTKKTSTITDKSNKSSGESNQMINTQIVRVVCDSKKKPRKRKTSSPKKDSKKTEAIARLKQALAMFNEMKQKALNDKVEIPASLGETPTEVNSVKTVSDIENLTQIILDRVRQIEVLIQKKQSRPSYFGMPEQTGGFAQEFTVNRLAIPSSNPTYLPSGGMMPSSGGDPNIENKLKDLEKGLIPGNAEDVNKIGAIEQERLRKVTEIQANYKTKQQALGIQLSQGKIDQASFDKQMRTATATYNEALRVNDLKTSEKISGLEKSKVGEGTEEKWKEILQRSNTLKIRIKSINQMGNVTEREIQELEQLLDSSQRLLASFVLAHRDDVERHPDLFPNYNAVTTQFKKSIRDTIRVPITDNRTQSDKIKHALRELEDINQMYLQLKEDVSLGGLSNADINRRLSDIQTQHNQIKELNKSRGVEPNDPALKDIEDSFKQRVTLIESMMVQSPSAPAQSPIGTPDEKAKKYLQNYIEGREKFRNWTSKMTDAMTQLNQRGWYYGNRSADTVPVSDPKVQRSDRVALLTALLAGTEPPRPPWYKEF